MTLPDSIAGYQHIIPEETTKEGDIYVRDGIPVGAPIPGQNVGRVEGYFDVNVYRKIPVAKQGGDPADWAKTEQAIRDGSYSVSSNPNSHGGGGGSGDYTRGEAGPIIRYPGNSSPLPTDAAIRKRIPIYSGFLKYFPRAVAAVAELSHIGNNQHNPGKPLHWDRSKSGDEADALMRHLMECDAVDKDGVPHAVKVAWRGMALAEKFLEKQNNK
jgi:hypothetical protein